MRNEERQALLSYLERLSNAPDPWFLALEGLVPRDGRHLDMRMAVLAVIGQELSPRSAGRVLALLEEALGEEFADAGRIPFVRLQAASTAVSKCVHWPHVDQLAGILMACSDFVCGMGLRERMERSGPHGFVRDMAGDIPFAGRSSPWRLRPWRLARWIVRGEGGFAPLPALRGELHVPPSVVARAWRYLDHSVAEESVPARQQEWSDRICHELSPGDPAATWVPFMLLRRPRGRVWACEQAFLEGCGSCPLRRPCDPPPRS